MVRDVLKGRCGKKRSSTDNESADAVMQAFCTISEEVRQCSRDIGIEKSSVHRILRAQKWKPYILRLVHELNEDNVVVGSVLWQKVDILNVYGLKEV